LRADNAASMLSSFCKLPRQLDLTLSPCFNSCWPLRKPTRRSLRGQGARNRKVAGLDHSRPTTLRIRITADCGISRRRPIESGDRSASKERVSSN
jgi:hypothetical protein